MHAGKGSSLTIIWGGFEEGRRAGKVREEGRGRGGGDGRVGEEGEVGGDEGKGGGEKGGRRKGKDNSTCTIT